MMAHEQDNGLFARAGEALITADPTAKSIQVMGLLEDFHKGRWYRDVQAELVDVLYPGRPAGLRLVPPVQVPKRGVAKLDGRLAFMHAVAHIEFTAINLALDAVHRFRDMPDAYYADWLKVADEEARHFAMVRSYMQAFGADYGDHPAHDGLWEMAVKTSDDVLTRMALVPRVLEARGLDVTPVLIDKLKQAGDEQAVGILEVIYEEEVDHVAAGTRWFQYLCEQRELEPVSSFFELLHSYFPDGLHGPYNLPARRKAGFSEREIAILTEGLTVAGN